LTTAPAVKGKARMAKAKTMVATSANLLILIENPPYLENKLSRREWLGF
jgi:hypothetical protein